MMIMCFSNDLLGPSDDRVELAKSHPIILGWCGPFGKRVPSNHPVNSEEDVIVCHPLMQETQYAAEPIVWLNFIMAKVTTNVLEIYIRTCAHLVKCIGCPRMFY